MNHTPSHRRRVAFSAALLAALTAAAAAQVTYKPIEGDPIRIDGGLVSGTYLKSGLKAYFGVPFAAPPIRENRWREPQPVQPWEGVLTANRMQPECVQSLRSNNINHYFGDEAAAEDCPSTSAVKMARYNAADEQLVEFGDAIKTVKVNTKGMDFIAGTPVIPAAAGGRR